MTNRQRAKLDSYNRVNIFNSNHAADLAAIAEYAAEQTAFTDAYNIINGAGAVQVEDTSGTVPVDSAKETMAQTIIQFTLRAVVKARQAGNITLANQLNEPITFITRSTKTEAMQRGGNLRNLLNDNLAILTNITAADIATIDAAMDAYNAMKDEPVHNRQVKKSAGTDVLPDAFTAADTSAENMYFLVRSYFALTKPELADELRLAIEIIDTGIHHTITDFTILADETGNALTGASITDISKNRIYNSDTSGVVHIDSHRSGHFNFTITATGRQEISFGADIKRGTENTFTIRLKLA